MSSLGLYGFPLKNGSSAFGTSIKPIFNESFRGIGADKTPTPYGQLIFDNYQRASLGSNYTKTGAQSCVITSNELVISGGARSATFAEFLNHTGYGYSSLDSVTQTIVYKVGTIPTSPTVDYLGLGQSGVSDAATDISLWAGVFTSTDASLHGKIRLYRKSDSTLTVVSTSATALTIALNDVISITYTRDKYTITVTAYNVTTNSAPLVLSYAPTTTTISTSVQLPSNAYFSLLTYGGTQNVYSWNVSTTENKYADYAIIGDSISEIFSSSSWNNTYGSQLSKMSGKSIIRFARANNVTSDIVKVLPEIVALNPKCVLIMVGGNDINFSIATATWKANLVTIWNTLKNNNIPFVNLFATPRSTGLTTNNVVPINEFYVASGYPYIPETYSQLASGITANSIYYAADLIHPNNAGHLKIAQILMNNL